MTLSEDDILWHKQNVPGIPIKDFEKMVEVFGTSAKDNDSEKSPNAKEVIEQASEEIMKQHTFITIEETGEIWYYDNGVYVPGGEILIAKECEKMFDYDLNNERLSQIKGHIMRKTYHKHNELDTDTNIINLKNGLYEVDNDVLKEHTPDYLSINQKPITYKKDANAERFEQFLNEVLYPRDVRTAVEAMAYTFERDYPFEVIFMLYGLGANGKTVYTSVLTSLHGEDNVSNVPLTQMVSDRFALADLEKKDVNIDNELGNQNIKDTAILKRLTGGSRQRIRIQRKNQRAYDTTLYAKLFFNANKIPDSEDESDAYNRRVIIITFPNRFEGALADKQLVSKLTTESEKSGIFNSLMMALRLIRHNKDIYVNEKTIEEKRLKYLRAHNPVKAFLEEAIDWEKSTEDDSMHYISKSDLHLVYAIYCEIHRLPIDNFDVFCKRVKKMNVITIDKEEVPITINQVRKILGEKNNEGKDKQTSCWSGITLTEEFNHELLDAKDKAKSKELEQEGQQRLD
jgi:putative DNA primase/helicase